MRVRFLCLLILIAFQVPQVVAQESSNPFRMLMHERQFEDRIFAAADYIERSQRNVDNPEHPVIGTKLSRIYGGGNVDRAGIAKGSIICQRGDYMAWANYIPEVIIHEPYTARVVDPNGVEEDVELEPGPLGASLQNYFGLDIAYLRSDVGVRDPSWDEAMVIACMYCRVDPVNTETALHMAMRNGYREDALTDFIRILLKTYSPDGAEREMEQFLSRFALEEDIPWVFVPALHEVLVTTGRIDFMERIARQAGRNCAFDQPTIDTFLEWTGGEKKWPQKSLLTRAQESRGQSIAAIFESVEKPRGRRIPGPAIDGPISRTLEPGEPLIIEFISDQKIPQNLHYHLTLEMAATGASRVATQLQLMVANLFPEGEPPDDHPKFRMGYNELPMRLLYLSLAKQYGNTRVTTSGSSLPGIRQPYQNVVSFPYIKEPGLPEGLQKMFDRDPQRWSKDPEPIEIDMIRFENELGIYVNQICVLHLPCDPDPDSGIDLNFHATGLDVHVTKQEIWTMKKSQ